MSSAIWRRLVSKYAEQELCDKVGSTEGWEDRLGLAFERVCILMDSDDVHPDDRLSALAYVAAWCCIGAGAEEERRRKEFVGKNMFYGSQAKKKRQGK